MSSRASQGQAKGQPGPGQGPAKNFVAMRRRMASKFRPRASRGPGQGASMHHGPCPATNGHPGRDTDLILRPSESTFDFLSVFIGFRSLNSVKMKVLDENIGFV